MTLSACECERVMAAIVSYAGRTSVQIRIEPGYFWRRVKGLSNRQLRVVKPAGANFRAAVLVFDHASRRARERIYRMKSLERPLFPALCVCLVTAWFVHE